ncbi:type VII secretion integral membrane protein EccD [Streptomyces lacrimifluminis]|uniref:Type VII secretion integral membrane protein EccD n=1 Tax=Streptomyces lacrimifluminis TaxID=1500077 RepID=A0A917KNA9_9ACTN|nr:type VII secretion integral membrane protein EccD [Streptomyces lacrimifluminis]GGJ19654.1 type VII secretion integral membrane protein EccD [Streptomyces lacrimifluminis]
MTDIQAASLCRVTVRAPARTVDLAVPSDVSVADLLPTVIGYGGDDLEESGLEHGGWVLQRLGGPPLDPESTLDSLGLRDGEALCLRPRTEALPEVHLDDLVDGISTTMQQRPHSWSAEASRRLLHGMAVAALTLGIVFLALPGSDGWLRALVASAAGLLLLAGAGSAARAVGDSGAGSVLGLMAVPYFALAGWLLPGGELGGADGDAVLGARLLAAAASGGGAAVLALAAVGTYPALFLGTASVAVAGALGAVLVILDLAPEQAAGVVAVVVVLFGGFVPSLSFRLSGMRMPPLPTNVQQLQQGIDPYPASEVEVRATLADGWMTGFYTAIGLICLPCLAALVTEPGLSGVLTVVALSLLLLLHSRGLGNVWQRLALTTAGVWGTALLLLVAARAGGPQDRLTLTAGLLALTATITIASWTVPGRRLLPYWGRAAELLHSLAAISLLPLTLWSMGVYGMLRGING